MERALLMGSPEAYDMARDPRLDELAWHADMAAQIAEASDAQLLGARRTLNTELRERGYCTDQDSAEGMFPVVIGFVLGALVAVATMAVWVAKG